MSPNKTLCNITEYTVSKPAQFRKSVYGNTFLRGEKGRKDKDKSLSRFITGLSSCYFSFYISEGNYVTLNMN